MKKQCRVVMLPTEKASGMTLIGGILYPYSKSDNGISQHLYILSDDEIKEGDWYIHKQSGSYRFQQCVGSHLPMDAKKIIATTDVLGVVDKDLSKSMGGEVERRLPQPSSAFIQKYIDAYNSGKPIEKVMVEYDVDSVIEESSGDTSPYFLKVIMEDNTISIETQKDSWTREEVVDLLKEVKHFVESTPNIHPSEFDKWIEENL